MKTLKFSWLRQLRWSFAILALGVAACGTSTPQSSQSLSSGTSVTVTAKDYSFDQTSISEPAGTTVTVNFVNSGSVTHSFTLDATGQEVVVAPGQSQTLTVTLPNSNANYAYHCKFHPTSMHGAFVVGSGGSSTPTASSAGGVPSTYSGY